MILTEGESEGRFFVTNGVRKILTAVLIQDLYACGQANANPCFVSENDDSLHISDEIITLHDPLGRVRDSVLAYMSSPRKCTIDELRIPAGFTCYYYQNQ